MDDSTSVHRFRELEDVPKKLLSERVSLEVCPVFEKLLNDIVAEDIIHQGVGFRQDLREDELLLFFGSDIILLLDESRPILIHGTLNDVVLDLFDLYLFTCLNLISQIFEKLALSLLYYGTRHTLVHMIHVLNR